MERPRLTVGKLHWADEPEATQLLRIRLQRSPGLGYGSSLELVP